VKLGWVPPVSPYGLIQETLWPDEWLILVSCIMLNQTQRKQVEKVWPVFTKRWPTPQQFIQAPTCAVTEAVKPLGFGNRRTKNLQGMTRIYLCAPWEHASDLPGIGQYGARAWEIFCQGKLGEVSPNDHALEQYWRWVSARRDDTVVL
jgi:methyl-CpG-binding domain protein 4